MPAHSAVRPEKTPVEASRVTAAGVHAARAETPWVTAAVVPEEQVCDWPLFRQGEAVSLASLSCAPIS